MEEQNEQLSVSQVAIKWGLILGIVSIVIFLITYFAGLMGNSFIGWLGPIATGVAMYLAHKEFKESGDGFLSYGKGLGIGTYVAAVSAVISSVFTFIYIKFINTDYLMEFQDMMRAQFEEKGMADEQIDAALDMMSKFQSPEIMLGGGILGGIAIGFVIALIMAAVSKKVDPSLEL